MKRLSLTIRCFSRVNSAIVLLRGNAFWTGLVLSRCGRPTIKSSGMSGIMDVTGSAESAPLRVGYPIW